MFRGMFRAMFLGVFRGMFRGFSGYVSQCWALDEKDVVGARIGYVSRYVLRYVSRYVSVASNMRPFMNS